MAHNRFSRLKIKAGMAAEEAPPADVSLFGPGERVCVAASGGADSTALLRVLLAQRAELGIVLSVLHVEHGLRGEQGMRDATFVTALARRFDLPCEMIAVDTRRRALEHKETIEEAARRLRYRVFGDHLAAKKADKIATAHTLDDQAETVLMKLLRGAWTEGLSGIHPRLRLPVVTGHADEWQAEGWDARVGEAAGCVVRPFLDARRSDIEAYLGALGQDWREDATNRDVAFTRNKVRHELLPLLRGYNPRIDQLLAHMAANALQEEEHWRAELARLLPQLLLPGRPARGGGRSVATEPGSAAVAMELAGLQALDSGLRRRVLRAAAEQCGAALDFEQTERLLGLISTRATAGKSATGRRLELPGNVRAERSHRELRIWREVDSGEFRGSGKPAVSYTLPIPGTVTAPAFRAQYIASMATNPTVPMPAARVRRWRDGDRVTLPHSRGPKKVKEVLQRLHIHGEERAAIPVVEWQERIIWMRGVPLAVEAGSGGVPEIREIAVGAGELD